MTVELPGLVIPAFQPEPSLRSLVEELLREPYPFVILVDDGSTPEHRPLFAALAELPRVRLLTHAINLGKGDALKSGFNEALVHFPEACGVVTVDADGQHLPEDVRRVAEALTETPDHLCLGVREFGGNVPLRSRFGNSLTRQFFRVLVGGNLRDTQTGLRGIPTAMMGDLLASKAARYEFELEMLIRAHKLDAPCRQIPITTVYEAGNRTSHFDPLFDSLRIYFVFIRFIASSMLTGLIDILAFSIAFQFGATILSSAVAGRLVAGSFNFFVNEKYVFRAEGSLSLVLFKYVLLVAAMTTVSYQLILGFVENFGLNVYFAKISVETFLFLVSFTVQRLLVFGPGRERWSP
ncbi:MAG: bifunctional glycosyltransferase family 2/GtrA family protein [Deltaproteobacteria bacterium]|nr:bifunctional glycosyltransferase family 2/GtrA family protein [Deltaproteobacteria bacterium]MBW2398833.1 bifunctional glycosyltransferase family 2/GtrA family protein [Deltaproteobacteria bacterium]MBW2666592.1 bifunctional glycosyltransferase family 2/GtrA family protein [Deltaproteobacteria bacterium]